MPYTIHAAKAAIKDGQQHWRDIDVFASNKDEALEAIGQDNTSGARGAAIAAITSAQSDAVKQVNAAGNKINRINSGGVTLDTETADMIAEDFNETKAYSAGTYVRKAITSGSTTVVKLYRLTADYVANSGWSNASKVEVKIAEEVRDLKSTVSPLFTNVDLTFVNNYYWKTDGESIARPIYYTGWSICNRIPCIEGEVILITTGKASKYNIFFNSDTDGDCHSTFSVAVGDNFITIPAGVTYFGLSNETAVMQSTIIKKVQIIENIKNIDERIDDIIGENTYILPIKSGTIGSSGNEDGRTSRIISTEYIYKDNYSGYISIPQNHSILIAYYDNRFVWKSNSEWMTTCNVDNLLDYPYVRIVARNNTRISDDISDELSTLQIVLHKTMLNELYDVCSKIKTD